MGLGLSASRELARKSLTLHADAVHVASEYYTA